MFAYSDTILVPLSLFLTIGYHAYLWRTIRTKPSSTTIGADALKRKSWFLALAVVYIIQDCSTLSYDEIGGGSRGIV